MTENFPETLGILGGGQLGRMLAQAAIPLGMRVNILETNSEKSPAVQMDRANVIPFEGSIMDEAAVRKFVKSSDVTTWENDHNNADVLSEMLHFGYDIAPDPGMLLVIQDKFAQKNELRELHIPVAPFSKDLVGGNALQWRGAVVKSRFGGFDGRGNLKLADNETLALEHVQDKIDKKFGDAKLYVEEAVHFDKELSVLVARDKRANVVTYPVVETIHKNNICHTVISPARIDSRLARAADDLAHSVAERFLRGAGIFAVEMFARGDDLFVNEIASRVHNSGHLTIEGNETSQFKQHVLAVTGQELGPVDRTAPAAVMVNILGTREAPLNRTGISAALKLPDTYVHFYGKSSRPERKIGHITVLAADVDTAIERATFARSLFTHV